MKVVFMGTPEFAATILKNIHEAGHEIVAVYSQPDRPKGRSGKPVASPVKEYALLNNMAVYQPERIKRPEEVELLKTFGADIFVVAAYGQIISKEILDIPRFGCVNTHGSLLPKLRGASPIQRSIANGDTVTGVTVMRMDVGVDTGDIISKVEVPIEDVDDEASMYAKLAEAGGKLLVETLTDIENGTATYTKQDDSLATYAPMLKKEEGLLDFSNSARAIDCLVRSYQTVNGSCTIGKVQKTLLFFKHRCICSQRIILFCVCGSTVFNICKCLHQKLSTCLGKLGIH